MPPKEFFIRLQHGIAGGFRPVTPSAIHTITSTGTDLHIQSAVRPDNTPSLQEPVSKSIPLSEKEARQLDELRDILMTLPTESPPGSEDIYGLDTSIAFGSEGFEWVNKAPAGCIHGISEVQPTEDHKSKFQRAVSIIKNLCM